jgi:hypothetical protein
MRRRAVLAIFGLLLLSAPLAFASEFIALGNAAVSGDELVQLEVSTLPNGGVRLEYTLNGFEMAPVAIAGQTYQQIVLKHEARFLDAGAPDLPKIARSVIIPDNAEMKTRLVSSSYQSFSDIDVAPSKGNLTRNIDPATVAYTFGSAYAAGGWFPADAVAQGDAYILRDFRGLVVDFRPFQYDAAARTLRVCEHAVIEVVPAGPGRVNVLDPSNRPAALSREFEPIYASHFVNFAEEGMRYADVPEVGEMLVIAYDSFLAATQPFVDWKNQLGIPATLVAKSEVGTTATQFASYISNYYNTHDLAFVLLVGDLAQIPSPTNGGAAADPVYSLVAGSDSYPDIFIGRLSAETPEQVALQVQKFVEYEQTPMAEADWYHMGTGIGSAEGDGIGDDGEADKVHIENIRSDLTRFTYTFVDQIYDPGATASQVATAVNQGRSIINYCGHGSTTSWSTTGFSNAHVAQLTNDNMLPFIVSVACVNGAFSGTCFAEAWLRASHGGEPTGAVGMYASTVNMSWAPPMSAQDESVDLLVGELKRTFGALCYCGSCKMIDEYNAVGEFKNWHIFGDPSLRVRTDTPAELTVQHDATIDIAATSFAVTVVGAPGALCGLSADGIFLGSTFADENGLAEIQLVAPLPQGNVTLTVTDFNALPYIVAVPVLSGPQPALTVTPDSLQVEMDLGEIRAETLFVTNSGDEGSQLSFTVTVSGLGSGTPWITTTPSRGTLTAGQTTEVQVTFDSSGLTTGIYNALITISAPDLNPVVVEATVTVGDASAIGDRDVAAVLVLSPAQPNPFAGQTALAFSLPQGGDVRLGVYDMSGRLVRSLMAGSLDAGQHVQVWDGRDDAGRRTPDGVYFYRLETANGSLSEKVMVLR